MKGLIKNFFAFGFTTALDKIVALLLLPLYARIFTVAEFGSVDLIHTLTSLISIFAFLQLETSLQRYYYTEKEKGKFIFSIFIIVLIFAIILAIVGVLISKKISFILLSDFSYQISIILALLQIPFSVILTINLVILRFEEQNKKFILVTIIRLLSLVGLVLLLIFKYGVLGLFAAQLLSSLLSSIVVLILAKKYYVFQFSFSLLKKAIKYALPQFPARVGSSTNAYANRFIINGCLNTHALGIFSASLKIGSLVSLVHSVFMMAWNQFMFHMIDNKKHKEIFSSIFSLSLPLSFMLVTFISLFSYEIIFYLMTPEYIDAYKYTGLISLSYVLIIFKEIVDIGPKYVEKTYYLSFNFFVSVVINLVCLFILVPIIGVGGAAISLVMTNLTLLFVSWYISNRIYPIRFSKIKFGMNILPVLFILLLVNFSVYQNLSYRILIFLIVSFFYTYMFLNEVKNYKRIVRKN